MTQTAKKSPFSMNVDLMHGPIFKNLLLFMLPIFISNLFQQLYNTVDTMIVGNVLGDTALAAIGSCGSIYELLVGFSLSVSATALQSLQRAPTGRRITICSKRPWQAHWSSVWWLPSALRWRVCWACTRCFSCWTPRQRSWTMRTATF